MFPAVVVLSLLADLFLGNQIKLAFLQGILEFFIKMPPTQVQIAMSLVVGR